MALALACPVLAAPATAAAQEPGTTNPAARFSEWPDDELFVAPPPQVTTTQRLSTFAPSSDLRQQTELDYIEQAGANAHDAIAAAAGRFLTPGRDSVLLAYRYLSTYVGLSFFRPQTASPIAKLPNLSARVTGGTDFFDLAAGDVDGQPVLDGEYRDEAVVAWAETDPSGKLPISVAVLAFDAATETSPAPTVTTTALASGRLDAASIAAGTIRPIANALSLALGDFNGDGAKEIALAYLTSPTALAVDIFKYSATEVNHTVQRSLTRVGSTTVTLRQRAKLEREPLLGGRRLRRGHSHRPRRTCPGYLRALYLREHALPEPAPPPFRTICSDGADCESSPAITIQQAPAVTDIGVALEDNGAGIARRVQIVAGLFVTDPQSMSHRQIAAAYADPNGSGRVGCLRLVQVDGNLGVTLGAAVTTTAVNEELFWLAAGAFQGGRSSTDPERLRLTGRRRTRIVRHIRRQAGRHNERGSHMAKVLVIGGSGFVSGTVARAAVAAGHQTWVVTRGQREVPAGVTALVADRKDRPAFAETIASAGTDWDVVYDCIGYFADDARQDVELFRDRTPHLGFISTDFVYDPPHRKVPQPEDTEYYLTDDSYGANKRRCELELINGDTGDMKWTIIRPCHIYGPGSELGCLPKHGRDPQLLRRIREGEPLELVGAGYFLQQPIFVRDLAAFFLSIMGNANSYGQIYNMYGPDIIQSRDYYEMVAEVLGTRAKIAELPVDRYREEHPEHVSFLCHRVATLDKMRAHGLAVPSTPFAEGIVEHTKDRIAAGR